MRKLPWATGHLDGADLVMAKKATGRAKNATVRLVLDLYVPVSGTDLEGALVQAKNIKVEDCVETLDGVEILDYSLVLNGIGHVDWDE